MEISSYARCFSELEVNECNNFLHLMEDDEYHDASTSTTQQLAFFSSENCQTGIPTSSSSTKQPKTTGTKLEFPAQSISQQLYSAGWIMKPKTEEIVYSNDVVLSFPPFNWNKKTSSSLSQKRNHLRNSAPPSKDHILAERKRRENISQRLIALSAIIPGLKKMDKASVLESATKYVKKLEERIRVLEEEMKKKKSLESIVFVKKSQFSGDEDSCCRHGSSNDDDDKGVPEIETRFTEKSVLIKIFCENETKFLPKLLAEVEKLHLTILNTTVLPFGNYAMDITISAQMDAEFCSSRRDLIRILRLAFLEFMVMHQNSI